MSNLYISINPHILNWLLSTVHDIEALELLKNWQNRNPTFDEIEDVSQKTNIPFGYFFLQQPPVESCEILKYSTMKCLKPSRNLITMVDFVVDIQEKAIAYAKENELSKLEFLGNTQEIKAEDILKKLRLKNDWYKSCHTPTEAFKLARKEIERIGIRVVIKGTVGTGRVLDCKEVRAFALADSYAPIIFINAYDTATGKLFSLFHELTFIWRGEHDFFNVQQTAYRKIAENSKRERERLAVVGEILSVFSPYYKKIVDFS